MKKKLFLNELRVKSFVTSFNIKAQNRLKAGLRMMAGEQTDIADCGSCDCYESDLCGVGQSQNCESGNCSYSVCACIGHQTASVDHPEGGGGCIDGGSLRC